MTPRVKTLPALRSTPNANNPVIVLGAGGRVANPNLADSLAQFIINELSPVFVLQLEQEFLIANKSYLKLFNIDDDDTQAIDAHITELKNDIEAIRADLTMNGKHITAQRSFAFDEHVLHFRISYFPLIEMDDRLVAVGGSFTEITQQINATNRLTEIQRSYNDILRSSSDWAWETDELGRILFVSDRITEILGRPPLMLRGKELSSLTLGPDQGEIRHQLVDQRTAFRHARMRLIDREGRIRYQELNGVPTFDHGGGAFTGYRGTGTDITREVEAEYSSEQARQRLEAALEDLAKKNRELDTALEKSLVAVRAKGEFLANMSHELRTPLNAIIGFADVIGSQALGSDSNRYAEYGGYVLRAGHHLLNLINDVLDWTQVENETLRIELTDLVLGPTIEEALSLSRERAGRKQITLIGPTVANDVKVRADATRLMQILLNLLTNAIKFTAPGGQIGISLHPQEDRIYVTVWDNGSGIEENKHQDIFEAFIQVHEAAHTRPHEGTGLGLPIARRLARLIGGDITVDSTLGQGSRFTVQLVKA